MRGVLLRGFFFFDPANTIHLKTLLKKARNSQKFFDMLKFRSGGANILAVDQLPEAARKHLDKVLGVRDFDEGIFELHILY
jgi:hypothetical protein